MGSVAGCIGVPTIPGPPIKPPTINYQILPDQLINRPQPRPRR
jgi:hypothetical protein